MCHSYHNLCPPVIAILCKVCHKLNVFFPHWNQISAKCLQPPAPMQPCHKGMDCILWGRELCIIWGGEQSVRLQVVSKNVSYYLLVGCPITNESPLTFLRKQKGAERFKKEGDKSGINPSHQIPVSSPPPEMLLFCPHPSYCPAPLPTYLPRQIWLQVFC